MYMNSDENFENMVRQFFSVPDRVHLDGVVGWTHRNKINYRTNMIFKLLQLIHFGLQEVHRETSVASIHQFELAISVTAQEITTQRKNKGEETYTPANTVETSLLFSQRNDTN